MNVLVDMDVSCRFFTTRISSLLFLVFIVFRNAILLLFSFNFFSPLVYLVVVATPRHIGSMERACDHETYTSTMWVCALQHIHNRARTKNIDMRGLSEIHFCFSLSPAMLHIIFFCRVRGKVSDTSRTAAGHQNPTKFTIPHTHERERKMIMKVQHLTNNYVYFYAHTFGAHIVCANEREQNSYVAFGCWLRRWIRGQLSIVDVTWTCGDEHQQQMYIM